MATKGILALLTTLIIAANAHGQAFLTNGLVAYYPFNGNANDASGNGNNATVVNATLTADRLGNVDSAYDFDGKSNYIEVPSTPSLLFSNQLTISAWIETTSLPGTQSSIVSKVEGDGWTGGFDFVVFKDLEQAGGSDAIVLEGAFSASPLQQGMGFFPIALANQWRHIVCVYSNQIQSFWIDGTAASVSNTCFGNIGQSSIPLRIGRREDPNNNWFSGSIDDIRIYNRALSSTEVQQLYQLEAGPTVNFVKAFTIDYSNLAIGSNYQLQASSDLNTWTNYGTVFTATSLTYTNTSYQRIDDWNKLFFRLQAAH